MMNSENISTLSEETFPEMNELNEKDIKVLDALREHSEYDKLRNSVNKGNKLGYEEIGGDTVVYVSYPRR